MRRSVPDGVYDAPPLVQSAILGQRCALLAGFLVDPDLHVRLWTDALLATLEAQGGDEPIRCALRTLLAACSLSDFVVCRSGIAEEGHWPDHHLAGRIDVPEDEIFDRLCTALELTPDDLESGQLTLGDLDPLVRRVETPHHERWRFPLIRDDAHGSMLLASPADLLGAALVHAAQHTACSLYASELGDQLQQGALRIVSSIAADMDCVVERATDTGALVRFDLDKLLAVEVVLQPLRAEAEPAPVRPLSSELDAAIDLLASARTADPDIVLGVVAYVGDGRATSWIMPDPQPPFGPWPVSLAGLRLIGDALRRDPLGLWRQLEHAPPPPWPPGAELTDIVGSARRLEEDHHPDSGDSVASRDGTEYLHQRARGMAARHPAPAPPDWRMLTVSRLSGSADTRIFVAERGLQHGTLLATAAGRFVWVIPQHPSADRGTLQATLVAMTAFWTARLLEVGWLLAPDGDELGIQVVIGFDDRPGPELAVSPCDAGVRVVVGPAFVHALCRGDNVADRALVLALVQWSLQLPASRLMPLVDAVCPRGHGTFTVWSQPDLRRQDIGPEPPPLIPGGVRKRVALEVAAHVIEPDHVAVIAYEQTPPCLDHLMRVLLDILDRQLDELGPEGVIAVIGLHERALVQEQREGIALPARSAMPGAEHLFGRPEADARRGLALRALVDRLAARPPHGTTPPSLERLTALRARAETLVEWGVARDAIRAGTARARLVVSLLYGVQLDADGPGVTAVAEQASQFAAAAPDRMLTEHRAWWTDEPDSESVLHLDTPIVLEDAEWRAVDAAMLEAWGFRWEELLRLLRALSDRALHRPHCTDSAEPSELLVDLASRTRIAPERIVCALGELRLGPCSDYDPLQREHKPWGVNRSRSYIRRPLVVLPDGRLAWSSEHVLRTSRQLHSLCLSNRLRETPGLRIAVGKLSQKADRRFELEVAGRARARGWRALEGRKQIGGLRLERAPGQPIGNLDVIAFQPAIGRVWLLEAKRLFPSLMPFGLQHESVQLAKYVTKHVERLHWVCDHPDRLECELGPTDSGAAWLVEAALVVDSPLAGAHVGALDLPIWTIDELCGHLIEPSQQTPDVA